MPTTKTTTGDIIWELKFSDGSVERVRDELIHDVCVAKAMYGEPAHLIEQPKEVIDE
jgi:hypothetical protein